jgi:hypothetical protein
MPSESWGRDRARERRAQAAEIARGVRRVVGHRRCDLWDAAEDGDPLPFDELEHLRRLEPGWAVDGGADVHRGEERRDQAPDPEEGHRSEDAITFDEFDTGPFGDARGMPDHRRVCMHDAFRERGRTARVDDDEGIRRDDFGLDLVEERVVDTFGGRRRRRCPRAPSRIADVDGAQRGRRPQEVRARPGRAAQLRDGGFEPRLVVVAADGRGHEQEADVGVTKRAAQLGRLVVRAHRHRDCPDPRRREPRHEPLRGVVVEDADARRLGHAGREQLLGHLARPTFRRAVRQALLASDQQVPFSVAVGSVTDEGADREESIERHLSSPFRSRSRRP